MSGRGRSALFLCMVGLFVSSAERKFHCCGSELLFTGLDHRQLHPIMTATLDLVSNSNVTISGCATSWLQRLRSNFLEILFKDSDLSSH